MRAWPKAASRRRGGAPFSNGDALAASLDAAARAAGAWDSLPPGGLRLPAHRHPLQAPPRRASPQQTHTASLPPNPTGEKLWRMPLDEGLKPKLDSPVADMKNYAGGRGLYSYDNIYWYVLGMYRCSGSCVSAAVGRGPEGKAGRTPG